jgi:hypothetical protein
VGELKERDSYETLSDWLLRNYYASRDYLWLDTQIRFGSLKTRCDVIGYEFKELNEKPTCKKLVGIHLFECKFDYAATQAFGQLLFYKEIVERYMNSKHYEAFNIDFYDGIKRFFQKNGHFPRRWKSTFWLPNKIELYLHLVLLKTGYVDETFFKFLQGSLDTFLDGGIGLLILKRNGKTWKTSEKRQSPAIVLERKRGPKPTFQMDPFAADIFYETRLDCRWFNKDGKRGPSCSENNISHVKCESCEWHIPV